jgi:glyoxylase-like metal-dependent hydrolase (beta-lactamase superfamily II)
VVKSIRILEAGFCFHPEAMVLPGSSFAKGRFPSTVVVIEHEREGIVLFDTGYSSDFGRITANFPERFYSLLTPVTITRETTARSRLEKIGIREEDVRHIILSHLHADHAGGVRDFSRATIHLDLEGLRFYDGLSRFDQVRSGYLKALMPDSLESRLSPIGEKTYVSGNFGLGAITRGHDIFSDGSVIAVPLPGHMAGHLGILVQTLSGERSLFVGDAAWRKESISENILPSFATRLVIKDWRAYKQTLSDLHALHIAHPELSILPCHCEVA